MQKALTGLPGVASIKADTRTATATMEINKGNFDEAKVVAALADVGFPGSELVPDESAPESNASEEAATEGSSEAPAAEASDGGSEPTAGEATDATPTEEGDTE